jgi:periodic tryptophan protein 2
VGHRLTHYVLDREESHTFGWESIHGPIQRIALSPDGRLVLAVDVEGGATLASFQQEAVIGRMKLAVANRQGVSGLAFSPCSQKVAVAIGGLVQIWRVAPNASTGSSQGGGAWNVFQLEETMGTGGADEIRSIDWSPCGEFLVVGGREMAATVLWPKPSVGDQARANLHAKYRPVVMTGHKHTIMGAFWSADGTAIHTVSREGLMKTWPFDRATVGIPAKPVSTQLRLTPGSEDEAGAGGAAADEEPALVRVKKEHVAPVESRPWVTSVAYNRTAGLLTVGFINGAFGLFSTGSIDASYAEEERLLYALSVSQYQIDAVAINASGEWLAFGCGDIGQLTVWEWRSESYILKQQGHLAPLTSLAYSPDGQVVASGGQDGRVKIWSVATGFAHTTFGEHRGPVVALHFVANGRPGASRASSTLLSASTDGTVRAYDLRRSRNFRTLATPHPVQFSALAVDPAGEIVAAGTTDTFQVFLWSLQTGKLLEVIDGHTGPISGLAFAPSGARLVSSSWDCTVRMWEPFARSSATSTGQVLSHGSQVLAVAFRPDGKEIAAACLSGELAFWDPEMAQQTGAIEARRDINETALGTGGHFAHLAYALDGSAVFAAGSFPWVALYEIKSRLLLRTYRLSSLHLSRDRAMIKAAKGESEPSQLQQTVKGLAVGATGRSFAVLAEEGLMLFGLDEGLLFDPVDLDTECTPESIRKLLSGASDDNDYLRALLMAFRLNIPALSLEVWAAIPADRVALLVPALPTRHLPALLALLASALSAEATSPALQALLCWICTTLQVHGLAIKAANQSGHVQAALRAIQKALSLLNAQVGSLAQENIYLTRFILQQAESQEPAPIA